MQSARRPCRRSSCPRRDTSSGIGSASSERARSPPPRPRHCPGPSVRAAWARAAATSRGSRAAAAHRRQCRRVLSAGQAENVAVSIVKPDNGQRWMLRMRSPCATLPRIASPETTLPNTV
ncbi:MAG: hypothetical protein DMD44_09640 [Gemmatimonadetes bacterium]|nr:MAG: hypothetical protein DMD44_09640 [Gemmatimonadota bacterium]